MRKYLDKKNKKSEWHSWFAWYPVVFMTEQGNVIVWLEKVCRKHTYGYEFLITEYSLNFDLIKN